MATIKSYTDLEQSKKLAEILPIESADMCFPHYIKRGAYTYYTIPEYAEDIDFPYEMPCWSLAALLDILSLYEIYSRKEEIQLDARGIALGTDEGETLLDLATNMILKLNEQNLL